MEGSRENGVKCRREQGAWTPLTAPQNWSDFHDLKSQSGKLWICSDNYISISNLMFELNKDVGWSLGQLNKISSLALIQHNSSKSFGHNSGFSSSAYRTASSSYSIRQKVVYQICVSQHTLIKNVDSPRRVPSHRVAQANIY